MKKILLIFAGMLIISSLAAQNYNITVPSWGSTVIPVQSGREGGTWTITFEGAHFLTIGGVTWSYAPASQGEPGAFFTYSSSGNVLTLKVNPSSYTGVGLNNQGEMMVSAPYTGWAHTIKIYQGY